MPVLLLAAWLAAAPAAPAAAGRAPPQFEALQAELARDHRDPRALVVLAELRRLEDELPDLPAAAAVYGKLAGDPGAHPEVRAAARLALADLERARGSLTRSQAELQKLGFVEEWRVAGPFDDEGKKGFATAYPPEEAPDAAGGMPGKVRPVRWRPLPPEARRLGAADLGAVLRPVKEVVAYALATLESPREQRVRLHLGAGGAVKLWVNGELALADEAYHPPRPDQLAVAVTLRKGPNRVLVKVCHDDGRLAIFLRVATAAGTPLRLAQRPATEPPPPAPRPAAEKPARVATVVDLLERRLAERERAWRRGKPGPPPPALVEAHADLARALAERRSDDDKARRAAAEARQAVEQAPGNPRLLLLAARLESDGPKRRALLEAARAAAPGDGEALLALGRHLVAVGQPQQAKPLLEAAGKALPGAEPGLALADAWEAMGLPGRAVRMRTALAAAHPFLPAPAAAAARAARGLDRPAEAARLWRKVLALRFDDGGARFALERLALEAGDVDGALSLQEEALRLDPGDLAARLRRADLLAANGREEEAEAAWAAAERICPEEPDLWERRGRARLRAGRGAEAVADLQQALELRPQNPQLKEVLRAVQPERERYEAPYLLDPRALAREAEGTPAANGADPEDVVVLGELRVVRVYPSGLASRFQQMVVRVRTDRGAELMRRHGYGYTPGRQELRVERARVTRPDGTVLDSAQESDRSASEPWYRLYYDVRSRAVTFPQLAAGDLLELSVRVDDVAGENLLSDYFGDVEFLGERFRRVRWEYVLLMPPGRPIYASDPPPGVTRADRELPGGTEHRWSARGLPRVLPEPSSPGPSETVPLVHVSTYASWDQVAAYWWGLVKDQLTPDAEVRRTAERIARETLAARRAAGLPEAGDERALVAAVHAFVVTNIRYVGLEFGIHGYKPYRVDEVLARRYGDCKDKASLTRALLQVLGIDARLVLLRMRHLGAMPARPASLSIFNHAISYLPKYDLWLDGTASFHGTHDLPGDDRGATVLVVNPDGPPRFEQLPAGRPEDNATDSEVEVALAADGSATLAGRSRVQGQPAAGYRRSYQSAEDRPRALEQAFGRVFPGLSVQQVEVSDLADLESPVELRFQLQAPRFAERSDGALSFRPFGAVPSYGEAWAGTSSRRTDLVVGDPHLNHFTYRIRLPEGLGTELPPPARGDGPFGAFEVTLRIEGRTVVAEGRVELRTGRVKVADYPAFRAFLSQLDQALARRVVARQGQQVGAPAAGALARGSGGGR